MSRPLRIEYEGAWYHVMNRGTGRKTIFGSDDQRKSFMELLDQLSQKFKVEIHAYCLMSNHYHLLIRTPLGNLSRAMRHLNGVYAQRFNRFNNTDGHLFRGRYKAILVNGDDYLLNLSRYVHLNPVAAKMCVHAWDYKWSSCNSYLEKEKESWLITDEIMSMFGVGEECNYRRYRNFLAEGNDEDTALFYKAIKKYPIFGSKEFVTLIAEKYILRFPHEREVPDRKALSKTYVPKMGEIIQSVARYYNSDVANIISCKRGKRNKIRPVTIYIVVKISQKTFSEIANEMGGITRIGISNSYRRTTILLNNDAQLRQEIEEIIFDLGQGAT